MMFIYSNERIVMVRSFFIFSIILFFFGIINLENLGGVIMVKNLKDLSQVSGGSVFNAPQDIAGDREYHYEVVDMNGNVLAKFNNKNKAKNYAIMNNLSDKDISWHEVLNRRNSNKIK